MALVQEQLIKQRAVHASVQPGGHLIGDLQQLQAVSDGDAGNDPALGSHDQGHPDERRLPGLPSHRVALAHLGQFSKGRAVAGAGHLLGQAPAGRREPRQPRQTGPE